MHSMKLGWERNWCLWLKKNYKKNIKNGATEKIRKLQLELELNRGHAQLKEE
jgi:hypothetical protein